MREFFLERGDDFLELFHNGSSIPFFDEYGNIDSQFLPSPVAKIGIFRYPDVEVPCRCSSVGRATHS